MSLKLKTAAVITTAVLLCTQITFGEQLNDDAVITDEVVTEAVEVVSEEATPTEFIDAELCDNEEVILAVNDYGIMKGYPDGSFRPDNLLTRAELCTVVARLIGAEHNARAMEYNGEFSDVSNAYWANKEIAMMKSINAINGNDDGLFEPDRYVSKGEALKIIVSALGYGDEAEAKGGYDIGYKLMAAELGIIDWTYEDGYVDREELAKLCFNSLKVKNGDGETVEEALDNKNFYVATDGNDSNAGTKAYPWKTFKKAAQTATAGTTVIFSDGTYIEESTTTVENSGKEGAPITFKSENKHGAIIKYTKKLQNNAKFQATTDYINVYDFQFTQEIPSTTSTSDIALRFYYNSNCIISGNKFYNFYEEGVKMYRTKDCIIESNIFIDIPHEGMDLFDCVGAIMRYNEMYNIGRTGFMVKGNCRNCQVYNNIVINDSVAMMDSAIGIGGSSDNTSPSWVQKGVGWENYYSSAYNNVVISKKKGLIPKGVSLISANSGRLFNNLVIGCDSGIALVETTGMKKGWEWDPPIVNPYVKNNIIVNCDNGVDLKHVPQGELFIENNLCYGVSKGIDVGCIVKNPNIIDLENDWHLKEGSPAINKGSEIESEYVGFGGEIVKLDMIDFEGKPRNGKWDIGIYSVD